MKINWKQVRLYADIAKKQEVPVENVQEQVANAILQQGRGIVAYHLADKVYKDNGDAEYTEKEAAEIERLTETMPAMWAVALKDIIE